MHHLADNIFDLSSALANPATVQFEDVPWFSGWLLDELFFFELAKILRGYPFILFSALKIT